MIVSCKRGISGAFLTRDSQPDASNTSARSGGSSLVRHQKRLNCQSIDVSLQETIYGILRGFNDRITSDVERSVHQHRDTRDQPKCIDQFMKSWIVCTRNGLDPSCSVDMCYRWHFL